MMNMLQKGQFGAAYHQALGKGEKAGKGKGGANASATSEAVPAQCGRCKGWHKHKLPDGKWCPNQISLDTNKLKEHLGKHKSSGETCQYWVTKGGGKKCGGEGHAYEEHLAAMKKYYASSSAPQKGKQDGKGKKGPGRGKGKETMAQAQEGAQIEGVPPDVQGFFQMAKDICGTMKEENRTMSIEEWAEVMEISCPGDGCEDPEVFAAMREAGM